MTLWVDVADEWGYLDGPRLSVAMSGVWTLMSKVHPTLWVSRRGVLEAVLAKHAVLVDREQPRSSGWASKRKAVIQTPCDALIRVVVGDECATT